MKLFPQETVLEIKTLLLMTDLAYCGYSYICMRRAFGEQYAFLFLLAIMVPRICQLSTRSIRCCCIFRAWVTVLRALLTLWGLFCYRFFSEGFNKRLYFIYIVHQFSWLKADFFFKTFFFVDLIHHKENLNNNSNFNFFCIEYIEALMDKRNNCFWNKRA